jgi:hypothetical protein
MDSFRHGWKSDRVRLERGATSTVTDRERP